MRVFFVKVIPGKDEPDEFSSGWAEAVTREGNRLTLYNCQTCITAQSEEGPVIKSVYLGTIKVHNATLTRVPLPSWFRREKSHEAAPRLRDRTV